MKLASLLFSLYFLACFAKAQTIGNMDSERGRKTKSAFITPKGLFQIETGFNYVGDREQGVKTSNIDLLNSLFRLGLTKNFEIRIESAYSLLSINDHTVNGLKPVKLGAKTQLEIFGPKGPEFSVIMAALPAYFGSSHFNNDRWGFDGIGAFSWQLKKSTSLDANFGVLVNNAAGVIVIPVSAAIGFPLHYNWNGYVEIDGAIIKDRHSTLMGGAGITYKQNNDLLFDTYIGKGVNNDANDWFFTIGFSWRMGPLFM